MKHTNVSVAKWFFKVSPGGAPSNVITYGIIFVIDTENL
jgi:hypothetical protein